jgi:hypothetical protein
MKLGISWGSLRHLELKNIVFLMLCTVNILFSEMAQGVENQCSIVLFLLMSVTAVHGTRYNLTETCEDQHGADLNGKL